MHNAGTRFKPERAKSGLRPSPYTQKLRINMADPNLIEMLGSLDVALTTQLSRSRSSGL